MSIFNTNAKTGIGERFVHLLSFADAVTEISTNLPIDELFALNVYADTGFQSIGRIYKFSGSNSIRFERELLLGLSVRIVAIAFAFPGAYWADNFILQDGVVNIDFKSQGEAGGSGELKTFSGSLTKDGQPVSRAVYALAIGGDVPKLLASVVSDDMGNYSLEWNGYTGQILVTATDDYGAPFAAEALLSIGARVHPATPNGYIYEAASSGTLGLTEPVWPVIEGESVTSGEVQLVAKPFYRPKSAGPFTIA